ncbi:histidine kinase [Haloimpatiens lingqiaonensis]|uniref:histidine kinase n=1 Tax=Haloimpatiens lingqiaonensis TaxID=1380675 RepID=UPI0010FE16DE|nr:histidine kinase [Haloimpatiens lingqiaonensis]
MKFNKLDLMLYIKNGNLNWILYLIASLVILIPIAIVFITGNPFSSSFSKISIGIAFIFVILGKFFALLKKEKGDKSIPIDIGIIIGLLIAFIR